MMLFMDTRLCRASDRFLALSKKTERGQYPFPLQAVELTGKHVPFLSQQRTVQNMHFIKDVREFLSVID